ncbi:hypothetical protein J7E73_18175 [Paenibacillus albidus]|uniref:hypothetical protein n=1 Tax=Paenibacillus albidus TaxID=2041023 RepID=UPI001BE74E1E|nr:hypothetical protein [Paenibacillus albidus]MBT2291029.1 hypothetical protein [Paenibacillus albidus]
MIHNRKYKYISIAIIVALLAEVAIITFPKLNNDTAVEWSSQQQDEQTAADLSNLTGVAVNQIMDLKKSGSSWSEITETLKSQPPANNNEDRMNRSNLLNEAGLDEGLLNELRQEGFQDDEIMEAKMLTERIMQQLKEVNGTTEITVENPTTIGGLIQSDEVDLKAAYVKINDQFNEGQSVKLILILQQELGSMEAVMNEYLLSLQIELNLEDYITDKKLYQENKEQKTITLKENEIVTMEILEKAMLEQLQQGQKEVSAEVGGGNSETTILEDKKDSPLPDINPPTVQDVMPQNPGETVRQEIQAINPNYR